MRLQARMIFRGSGKEDSLIIATAAKGQTFFEENAVYEIVEMLGEMVIRKVGESIVRKCEESEEQWPTRFSWNWRYYDIIDKVGTDIWLTREEYAQRNPEFLQYVKI